MSSERKRIDVATFFAWAESLDDAGDVGPMAVSRRLLTSTTAGTRSVASAAATPAVGAFRGVRTSSSAPRIYENIFETIPSSIDIKWVSASSGPIKLWSEKREYRNGERPAMERA